MNPLDRDDFTSREAATLREHGYTTEHAIYDAVGNLYLSLNETELQLLVGQLQTALNEFQTHALRIYAVRRALYNMYNDRSRAQRTTSVFSPDFNMSLKDHNYKVREAVDRAFAHAATSDIAGMPDKAIEWLMTLGGIRQNILFSPEVVKLVLKLSPAGGVEFLRIKQFRTTLFRCIVPLAAKIARNQAIPLKATGTTLDFPDVLQEAFIAAMDTIEKYRPISGGRTLTSFIFTSVNGVISRRKAELSRNVAVPRVVMDRFGYVQKAADELDIIMSLDVTHDELVALAERASSLMPVSKKKLTPLETLDLIQTMQSEASLSVEVDDEDGVTIEVGDLIEAPTDLEAELDAKLAGGRLLKLIKRFTTPSEFELLQIRWGGDDVLNYQATSQIYYARHEKPMNKTVVASIEKAVFRRIREAAASDAKVHDSFMQILATLA